MKTPPPLEKAILLAVSLALMASRTVMGHLSAPHTALSRKAILDLKTNVMYCLDSDLRHIDAIDPKSKLLWRNKVIPVSGRPIPARPNDKIALIRFDERNQNLIDVWFSQGGVPSVGVIDEITGVFTFQGSD
jgi:hypothetical protein